MSFDADVAALAASDALHHGSVDGLALPEVPWLAPRGWEAQRDEPIGAAGGAKDHGADSLSVRISASVREGTNPDSPAYDRAMECVLAVICKAANTDEHNNLNIMGVFTDLTPDNGWPAVLPEAFLVASFTAGPPEVGRDKLCRVEMRGADGEELGFAESTLTVPRPPRPGSRASMNLIQRLGPLAFDKEGDFSFHILVDGDEKRSVSIHVNPRRS